MKNYFLVNRSMFENKLWFEERFTKAQAWIDILGNANYKNGSFFIRGNEIKVARGQLGWSEVTMAKRWRWSRTKVRRFLFWLEKEQQIRQQKDRFMTTILTIINYNKYQNDTADDTAEKQQTIHNIHKDNKVSNNKDIYIKKISSKKEEKTYTEDKLTLKVVAEKIVLIFNETLKRKFGMPEGVMNNLAYWLDTYTPQEIEQAIYQIPYSYWKDKITPTILFRKKNPSGEPVDYIGQLLNNKEKSVDKNARGR